MTSTVNIDGTLDFPFVAELPHREKSKVAKLWDRLREIKAVADQHGLLLPPAFAARALGISPQRVNELMNEGRFKFVDFDGHRLVTEDSVVAYARSERKAGRPCKVPSTMGEKWDLARSLQLGSK